MTLSMAWVRTLKDREELVFCSDSRLRFGCAWDACQKVFPLPRGDCAITFAGDTKFAFPFIHAAMNAVSLHQGSRRRLVDITVVKPFLLKAINSMLSQISDFPQGETEYEEPELRLVFGGYSWLKKEFVIWKFHFNPGEREFRHAEVRDWKGLGSARKIIFLGDPEASLSAMKRAQRKGECKPNPEDDVQELAKKRFIELLADRNITDGFGLNMEPFEVLRDMLRSEISPHVGGSPQLVKIYQHLNAQPFGIRWASESRSSIAILGRVLEATEKAHVPVLNPDTLDVERSNGVDSDDASEVEVVGEDS